jgi:hypothetical protein
MCRTNLHMLAFRVLDLALDPALKRSVVASAGRQTEGDDEPKSDERSENKSSHIVRDSASVHDQHRAGQKLRGFRIRWRATILPR